MDVENTPSQPPAKNNAKIITTVAVLLVAVLLVVGVKAFAGKSETSTMASTSSDSVTNDASATTSSSAADSNATYKDGTYKATGSYMTPESTEEITVSVTLKDGKITETSATTDPQARESKEWQSRFLGAYKNLVVGKSINDVKLSRVSGSSLTSNGFNKAIDSIKNQAKA